MPVFARIYPCQPCQRCQPKNTYPSYFCKRIFLGTGHPFAPSWNKPTAFVPQTPTYSEQFPHVPMFEVLHPGGLCLIFMAKQESL